MLKNLPCSRETLDAVLERSRDVDTHIRKMVYTEVLEKYCIPVDPTLDKGGYTNPRALKIAQRELIVKNGLGDREEAVKTSAARLLGKWLEVLHEEGAKKEQNEDENMKKEANEETIEQLVEFVTLFDLMESTNETTAAEMALGSVFDTRMDIFEHLEFPGMSPHAN